MEYTITINTDNAAFGDAPEIEIANILHNLATRIEAQGIKDKINLYDFNGNFAGQAKHIEIK